MRQTVKQTKERKIKGKSLLVNRSNNSNFVGKPETSKDQLID